MYDDDVACYEVYCGSNTIFICVGHQYDSIQCNIHSSIELASAGASEGWADPSRCPRDDATENCFKTCFPVFILRCGDLMMIQSVSVNATSHEQSVRGMLCLKFAAVVTRFALPTRSRSH